jgi:hypothetical protein
MASSRSPSPDALPSDALVRREGLRLLGAVVVLLVAALVIAGGLLWREHARARMNARTTPVTAVR